ncbi:MAG: thioredoxin-dependent thiol peroxidase [Breznakibacter sp.]|nr:thioredoxin-dependent thiol peroxidase [Breznakibacter sp.]
METLQEGVKAPDFKGLDHNGNEISLNDFKGKKIILYFYPKDNTPGCTAEACNLNDNFELLTQKGFVVIGVSPDSPTSHQKFMAKFNLQFTLIADPEKTILTQYESYGEKMMYGKPVVGVIRKTYLIDEEGTIQKIIKKVDTKNHTEQILKYLA